MKAKIALEGTPKEVFAQVDLLRRLHLDVPQVTDLAQRLQARGFSDSRWNFDSEEMVMHLCPSG